MVMKNYVKNVIRFHHMIKKDLVKSMCIGCNNIDNVME